MWHVKVLLDVEGASPPAPGAMAEVWDRKRPQKNLLNNMARDKSEIDSSIQSLLEGVKASVLMVWKLERHARDRYKY